MANQPNPLRTPPPSFTSFFQKLLGPDPYNLVGGNSNIFSCLPLYLGRWSNFDQHILSDGLKLNHQLDVLLRICQVAMNQVRKGRWICPKAASLEISLKVAWNIGQRLAARWSRKSRSPWFFVFIKDAGGGVRHSSKGISGIGFKRVFLLMFEMRGKYKI